MFIKVNSVSKVYEISRIQEMQSLLHMLFRGANHAVAVATSQSKVAVDNISFEIAEGERIGIIGHNGAGKTTLLQMIAGLAAPTSGSVQVEGHVNCVMTLGIGLREECTGRENIYLDGELQGKSAASTGQIIEEIISFADLGEFIDLPVRTYSSGMKARLAFAMIIFIEPEILIVDEALSAGDARFGMKATAKMKEICAKGKILLLVSHSMPAIVDMCDRCLWMDHGRLVMNGPPSQVTEAYLKAVRESDEEKLRRKFHYRTGTTINADGVHVSLDFIDAAGDSRTIFEVGDEIDARCVIETSKPFFISDVCLSIQRTDGVPVITSNFSNYGYSPCQTKVGKQCVNISIGKLLLGKGVYEVRVEVVTDVSESNGNNTAAAVTAVLQIDNNWYPYANPISWQKAVWKLCDKD